jgi:hypothetical protein
MATTRTQVGGGEQVVTVVLNEQDAFDGTTVRIVIRKGDNGVAWAEDGYEDEIIQCHLCHDTDGSLYISSQESANMATSGFENNYPDYFTVVSGYSHRAYE